MKIDDIKAPYGDNVLPTNVRNFTCTSASRADAIPASWSGRYIKITNETANTAQYFFSKDPAATCDETIAAANDGGASVSLGDSILGNTVEQILLPFWQPTETMYLVRASVSTTNLRLAERSN
jgi:hypothetical protein